VWFTIAGSDHGPAAARAEYRKAAKDPVAALRSKVDARLSLARNTVVDLPGDRALQQSVEWSKQNLADSVQEAHDLALRDTDEGRAYPDPAGTLAEARWYGAGFPDYPWLFGTDGEYTSFAAVAAGQFEPSRRTCGRCGTSARSSTPAAGSSSTRSSPPATSTSARTTTRATPTRP
jgi:hypothetical protein